MNRSTSLLVAAPLALATIALAGCGASVHSTTSTTTRGAQTGAKIAPLQAATAAAPATPAKPLATVAGSVPYSRLSLLSLRRTGPKVVSAQLELGVDRRSHDYWKPELNAEDGDPDTADGVLLVDEVNGREHFPLRDPDGRCLCSTDLDNLLDAGDHIVVGVKFPAPPAEVKFASIQAPGFPAFDHVPLG